VGGRLELPGGGTLPAGGGDFTPNEVEIWYSSRDRFRVRLTDPNGEQTAVVEPGDTVVHDFATGDVAFLDSERFTVLNGDARVYIELSHPGDPLAEGVWQIEIEAEEARDGRFDAWIERDTRRSSNQFADQSFFVGTDFDQIRTLGTPSTGRRTIAVANYSHVSVSPSNSSGRGTTRDGREKPEIAAPGTQILSSNALGGRPNPDPSPGQPSTLPMRIPMSGTSMAAPHVAGIVALLFEADGQLTAEQVRKILVASAHPPAGVQPFDPAWGFGRVDAQAAIELLGG
jgi:subtilisin family serine protease